MMNFAGYKPIDRRSLLLSKFSTVLRLKEGVEEDRRSDM